MAKREFHESDVKRWPAKTPGSKGGEFAPEHANTAAPRWVQALEAQLSPKKRPALLAEARKRGMSGRGRTDDEIRAAIVAHDKIQARNEGVARARAVDTGLAAAQTSAVKAGMAPAPKPPKPLSDLQKLAEQNGWSTKVSHTFMPAGTVVTQLEMSDGHETLVAEWRRPPGGRYKFYGDTPVTRLQTVVANRGEPSTTPAAPVPSGSRTSVDRLQAKVTALEGRLSIATEQRSRVRKERVRDAKERKIAAQLKEARAELAKAKGGPGAAAEADSMDALIDEAGLTGMTAAQIRKVATEWSVDEIPKTGVNARQAAEIVVRAIQRAQRRGPSMSAGGFLTHPASLSAVAATAAEVREASAGRKARQKAFDADTLAATVRNSRGEYEMVSALAASEATAGQLEQVAEKLGIPLPAGRTRAKTSLQLHIAQAMANRRRRPDPEDPAGLRVLARGGFRDEPQVPGSPGATLRPASTTNKRGESFGVGDRVEAADTPGLGTVEHVIRGGFLRVRFDDTPHRSDDMDPDQLYHGGTRPVVRDEFDAMNARDLIDIAHEYGVPNPRDLGYSELLAAVRRKKATEPLATKPDKGEPFQSRSLLGQHVHDDSAIARTLAGGQYGFGDVGVNGEMAEIANSLPSGRNGWTQQRAVERLRQLRNDPTTDPATRGAAQQALNLMGLREPEALPAIPVDTPPILREFLEGVYRVPLSTASPAGMARADNLVARVADAIIAYGAGTFSTADLDRALDLTRTRHESQEGWFDLRRLETGLAKALDAPGPDGRPGGGRRQIQAWGRAGRQTAASATDTPPPESPSTVALRRDAPQFGSRSAANIYRDTQRRLARGENIREVQENLRAFIAAFRDEPLSEDDSLDVVRRNDEERADIQRIDAHRLETFADMLDGGIPLAEGTDPETRRLVRQLRRSTSLNRALEKLGMTTLRQVAEALSLTPAASKDGRVAQIHEHIMGEARASRGEGPVPSWVTQLGSRLPPAGPPKGP